MAKRPQQSRADAAMHAITGVSRALAAFRWIFMPLGLFALIAVGVHAGADVIDDVLARLGEAAGMSRVYVFENRTAANGDSIGFVVRRCFQCALGNA